MLVYTRARINCQHFLTYLSNFNTCFQTLLHPLMKILHPFTNSDNYTAPCRRRRIKRDGNISNHSESALPSMSSNTEDPSEQAHLRKHPGISDWVLWVNLIDRALFIIYSICLVVCVVLYFPRPETNWMCNTNKCVTVSFLCVGYRTDILYISRY
jgi:hypothetical protein